MGVVGGGLMAQAVHLPLLAERPERFTLVALADPSPAVRGVLGRRYGLRGVFADHREMLAAGQLDAVLVASPNGTHAAVVLDALACGLDVLVEKPLCIATADADRIVAAQERSGRVVQVG
jgi:predicted dehydrogenase